MLPHRCCIFILSISCRIELSQPDCEDRCSPVMNASQVHQAMVSSLTARLKYLSQLSGVSGESASETCQMPPLWVLNHRQLSHRLPFCRTWLRWCCVCGVQRGGLAPVSNKLRAQKDIVTEHEHSLLQQDRHKVLLIQQHSVDCLSPVGDMQTLLSDDK